MFNLLNKSDYFEAYNAGKISSAVAYALPHGVMAQVDELCGVSTLTLNNSTFTNDQISTVLAELNIKGTVLIEFDNQQIYVGPSLQQGLIHHYDDLLDRITVNVIGKCTPTDAAAFPIVQHNPIKIDHHQPSKAIDRFSRNPHVGTIIIEAEVGGVIKHFIFNPNRYVTGKVIAVDMSERPTMLVEVIRDTIKYTVKVQMFSRYVRNDLVGGKICAGDEIVMLYSSFLGNNKLNAFTSPTVIKYRK